MELTEVMTKIRDLPALPSVILEVISTLEHPDVDVVKIADKISRDQALAAKVLRLANSSFYGLPSKVNTVAQAIIVLGIDSARALVAAGGVIDNFSSERGGEIDVANFWRHSVAVALCAKNLARQCGQNPDHAFIAGLLHDIGRLLLASRFPAQYAHAVAYAREHGVSRGTAERQVLGVDHLRAGMLLANMWKFPIVIQQAIGHHHAPRTEDLGGLPSIIHVADAIVYGLDLEDDEDAAVPCLSEQVWSSLEISSGQLQVVFGETEGQFEEACNILIRGGEHA